VAALSVIGCTHDEYVYHHKTVTYASNTHHYHSGGYSSGGYSQPGQPTHLAAPGAPETFRAVGSNQ